MLKWYRHKKRRSGTWARIQGLLLNYLKLISSCNCCQNPFLKSWFPSRIKAYLVDKIQHVNQIESSNSQKNLRLPDSWMTLQRTQKWHGRNLYPSGCSSASQINFFIPNHHNPNCIIGRIQSRILFIHSWMITKNNHDFTYISWVVKLFKNFNFSIPWRAHLRLYNQVNFLYFWFHFCIVSVFSKRAL